MENYNIFILSFLIFVASYAIGARTFHPAVLIEYRALQPEMFKCQEEGAEFKIVGDKALCVKTEVIFTTTINNSYFR